MPGKMPSTISIPCYLLECQQRFSSMNNLLRHLKMKHGVVDGFGCSHCGYRDLAEESVRSHILQHHQTQERPCEAAVALAHYFRKKYQDSDPSVRDLDPQFFWRRGQKSKSQESTLCHLCDAVIAPHTTQAVLQHLCSAHKIVVDLDCDRICNYENCHDPGEHIAEAYLSTTNDEDPEILDADDHDIFGCHQDDDDQDSEVDNDVLERDRKLQVESEPATQYETVSAQGHVAKPAESLSSVSSPHRSETQLSQFMGCIKQGSIKDVEDAFKMHETRIVAGRKYRVHKSLPADMSFDSGVFVYAVLLQSGWSCKVPQCGATLDEEFAVDMHLWAHDEPFLQKWYCGDSSCFTDIRTFFDHDGFNLHIIDEHMGSSYSRAAGRRVPKGDVLVATLANMLHYEDPAIEEATQQEQPTNSSKGSACTVMLENTAQSAALAEGPVDERRAWATFRSTTEENNYSESDEDSESESDEDIEFLQHCSDRYVFLSQAPQDLPPLLFPPNYLVETLTGLRQMDEAEAKMFIKSYCKLCRMLGTDDEDELRRWLGLEDPDTPEVDEQQISAHEVRCSNELENPRYGEYCEENRHPGCPWPQCGYTTVRGNQHLALHFVTVHLNCVWQCPEKGCEYCDYLDPHILERHRMNCHVGSPLQCGHKECAMVRVGQPHISRGHMNYNDLRIHFETQFNSNLLGRRMQPSWLDSNFHYLSEVHEPTKPLPSVPEYLKLFAGGSSAYLNEDRRAYRRTQNYKTLARYGIQLQNIEVRGSKRCTGFSYGTDSFDCADSVSLGLDTAIMIFVPSKLLFTVAPTCDYCIHAMSLMSRPLASLPPPMCFQSKNGTFKRERRGIGSTINDHITFLRVVNENPLPLTPLATKAMQLMHQSPETIFIVDFESVRRSQPNTPLYPTEITVRNGNGHIVISCTINEKGVTNAQFENQLRSLGYSDNDWIKGLRRIRGHPDIDRFPRNAKTPKEIIDKLLHAGLSPQSFWIEYSTTFFDRRCMEVLLERTGKPVRSILPPRTSCWTVANDLMKCLPGLASYKLGRVVKLMDPKHPDLARLHFSDADTAILLALLRCWLYKYGSREHRWTSSRESA